MSERVLVRCVHGLEWVCAAEVARRLPGAEPALARRQLTISLPQLDPRLLELRTVDDVFLEVGDVGVVGRAANLSSLGRHSMGLPWCHGLEVVGAVRGVPASPLLDVVASVEGPHRYSRFDLEQAVGSRLADRLGGRYLARTAQGVAPGQADLTVRVLARPDRVTLAVRVAARPLHRRAYKRDTGPGTLHPPAAAALVLLTDPSTGERVVDPFCGDGTIAVEAALAAPGARITGTDLDRSRLDGARRNARRAGVTVEFAHADAADLDRGRGLDGGGLDGGGLDGGRGAVDVVVTNPPWNLAVDAGGSLDGRLDRFWDRLANVLGSKGRLGVITDVGLDAPSSLAARGLGVGLATQLRLAGRLCHLTIAAPAGRGGVAVPDAVVAWRRRAVALGVATEEGFG